MLQLLIWATGAFVLGLIYGEVKIMSAIDKLRQAQERLIKEVTDIKGERASFIAYIRGAEEAKNAAVKAAVEEALAKSDGDVDAMAQDILTRLDDFNPTQSDQEILNAITSNATSGGGSTAPVSDPAAGATPSQGDDTTAAGTDQGTDDANLGAIDRDPAADPDVVTSEESGDEGSRVTGKPPEEL